MCIRDRWEKIDFENHIVCIDTSLLYLPKLGIYESTTKTENTTFLPLPEETMQLLREYRAWYNELRLKNGDRWQDSGFLFVDVYKRQCSHRAEAR